MSTVIETIGQDAADLYARTVLDRTVSNGRVEAYGLKWFSPSLRLYELNRKQLGQSANVEVLIDEFDLSNVRVMLPNSGDVIRPSSTQPEYVAGLSLYEHQKIREHLREKAAGERLARMSCAELVEQRKTFRTLLEALGDKAARRQYARIKTSAAGEQGGTASSQAPSPPRKPRRKGDDSGSSKQAQTPKPADPAPSSKLPEAKPAASANEPIPPDRCDTNPNGEKAPRRQWTPNFPATDAERPKS